MNEKPPDSPAHTLSESGAQYAADAAGAALAPQARPP
jgi:hypothetical protein